MNVWFLGNATPSLVPEMTAGLPNLTAWRKRVKGHRPRRQVRPLRRGCPGHRQGRRAAPAPPTTPTTCWTPSPATPSSSWPDDYGKDQVRGVLVAATPTRIVIAREHELTGKVHVHFPARAISPPRA